LHARCASHISKAFDTVSLYGVLKASLAPVFPYYFKFVLAKWAAEAC